MTLIFRIEDFNQEHTFLRTDLGRMLISLAGLSVNESQLEYSAVLYLCYDKETSIISHVFAAKTNVAPWKTLTNPRLELYSSLFVSSVRQAIPKLSEASFFSFFHRYLYRLVLTKYFQTFVKSLCNPSRCCHSITHSTIH